MFEPTSTVRTAATGIFSRWGHGEGHTAQLVDSHNVISAKILDFAGDEMGRVDGLMIDKRSGGVRYVVMSRGGLLGLARDRYAIPWETLEWVEDYRAYFSDLRLEDVLASPPMAGGWHRRTDAFAGVVARYWRDPTGGDIEECPAT